MNFFYKLNRRPPKNIYFWIISVIILTSTIPIYAQETIRERIRERILERLQNQNSSQQEESADPKYYLSFGGIQRYYLLHVPSSYDGTKPVPLVIVLHGGGGKAEGAVRMADMDPRSDKQGFIVVYPNGTSPMKDRFFTWNSFLCCGYALQNKIDDVGFINALLDELEKNYSIDSTRIFATGLSNGGMMTYKLGCELSDRIAAIAPVAGALDTDDPDAAYPVSAIIFHGTADLHVLYDGGVPKKAFDKHPRTDKPVSYAVSYWVKRDGCSPTPKTEKFGSIIHDTYSGGIDGTEVQLYTIVGQGHAWPGGKPGIHNSNVDPPTQEISATDLMLDFFMKHPKTVKS